MSRRATIVMYHFARDLQRSRYPRITGLETDAFAGTAAARAGLGQPSVDGSVT